MSLASLIIVIALIVNVIWLNSYDPKQITKTTANPEANLQAVNARVRIRAIFTISGNVLILGTFSALVAWSIDKKAFSLFFSAFWGFIFITNAIGTQLYFFEVNALTIVSSVLNSILAIMMFADVLE